MVAGKNETVKSCIRKGFNFTKEGTDHVWFESKIGGSLRAARIRHNCRSQYVVDGERIALTCVSHGPDEDLTPKRLKIMGEQCHLSREQFYLFAKCYMSEDQYRQILIDKGIIKGD